MKRTLPTLALSAAAAVLTGCGGASSESGESPSAEAGQTADSDHNQADVAFATDMIPHHAQALAMTDMAVGRQLDQELTVLVDDLRAAQAPEIELMVDWLQEWGEPVPETVRDHAHGGHDDADGDAGEMDGTDGMDGMDGMMSEEQLAELEDAPAAEFEELWLTTMVEHHEGAVAKAETQLEDGTFPPALELAEEIVTTQTEEIELMQGMLED